jgi:hypothetical protein
MSSTTVARNHTAHGTVCPRWVSTSAMTIAARPTTVSATSSQRIQRNERTVSGCASMSCRIT